MYRSNASLGREAERRFMEDKVVWLVNMERFWRDLPALRADERLRESARGHSADMARLRQLAHVLPNLPNPLVRMLMSGVESPAGENVAFGHESPAGVVDGWMHSPPHKLNLLAKDFRTIGVGLHVSADGYWWTQNFGY